MDKLTDADKKIIDDLIEFLQDIKNDNYDFVGKRDFINKMKKIINEFPMIKGYGRLSKVWKVISTLG